MPKADRYGRKAKTGSSVPTSSMADIAFLLLVFFMVTTIFRLEDGLKITLPDATELQTIPREKVAKIAVAGTAFERAFDRLIGVVLLDRGSGCLQFLCVDIAESKDLDIVP